MAKERKGCVVEKNGKLYARITCHDGKGRRRELMRLAGDRREARRILNPCVREENKLFSYPESWGLRRVTAIAVCEKDVFAGCDSRAFIRSVYGFILRRSATKKRSPGNAKDLDNDNPHGRATAPFRTCNCNPL